MIAEPSKLKSKYKMAIVEDAKLSRDNLVRSAVLRYHNLHDVNNELRARPVRITRSVQRLVLVLPVEEQSTPVDILDEEDHFRVVSAYSSDNN